MLTRDQVSDENLDAIKRQLSITWTDDDTDDRIADMAVDGSIALDHILGAEIDYFAPGMERRLFMNYMLYAWNDSQNEFEEAYLKEINRIRHIYKVKGAMKDAEKDTV